MWIGETLFETISLIAKCTRFWGFSCENVKYVGSSKFAKDSMDMNGFGYYSDHMIESLGHEIVLLDLFYCMLWILFRRVLFFLVSSFKSSIWCVGLKTCRENSVLNISMSRQEYEGLVPKNHRSYACYREWGEFFHPSISPFGYNETIGADDQPLDRPTVENMVGDGTIFQKDPQEIISLHLILPSTIPRKSPKILVAQNIDTLPRYYPVWKSGEPFRILKEELSSHQAWYPYPTQASTGSIQWENSFMNRKLLQPAHCAECACDIQTTITRTQEKFFARIAIERWSINTVAFFSPSP